MTFSKLQKKQYEEIKKLFGENDSIIVYYSDYVPLKDVFDVLQERQYISLVTVDGARIYYKESDFKGFDEWLKDQEHEARKVKIRDLIFVLLGATLPYFIPFIVGMVKNFFA